jgi:hypothetical protein
VLAIYSESHPETFYSRHFELSRWRSPGRAGVGVSQDSRSLLQEQMGVMLLMDCEKQSDGDRDRE